VARKACPELAEGADGDSSIQSPIVNRKSKIVNFVPLSEGRTDMNPEDVKNFINQVH
jgi:hypothetical protein